MPGLSFGVFIAPYHPLGDSPLITFRRDLELIEWCDRLGLRRGVGRRAPLGGVGEHRRPGHVPRRRRPAHAADPPRLGRRQPAVPPPDDGRRPLRAARLPDQRPGDARRRPRRADLRRRDDGHRSGDPAAAHGRGARRDRPPARRRGRLHTTDWFELHEARLQMLPVNGSLPIAVASTTSPSGMVCAGTHGVGVLSLGAGLIGGKKDLAAQWAIGQKAAAAAGQELRREDWRLVLRAHLADSREEAIAAVRDGREHEREHYYRRVAGMKNDTTLEEEIEQDTSIIGTPDDMIAALHRLQDATGGFGGFMVLANDWAPHDATLRSYELIARRVMPEIRGHLAPLRARPTTWSPRTSAPTARPPSPPSARRSRPRARRSPTTCRLASCADGRDHRSADSLSHLRRRMRHDRRARRRRASCASRAIPTIRGRRATPARRVAPGPSSTTTPIGSTSRMMRTRRASWCRRSWDDALDDIAARLACAHRRARARRPSPATPAPAGPLDPSGYALAQGFFRASARRPVYSALSIDCSGKFLVPAAGGRRAVAVPARSRRDRSAARHRHQHRGLPRPRADDAEPARPPARPARPRRPARRGRSAPLRDGAPRRPPPRRRGQAPIRRCSRTSSATCCDGRADEVFLAACADAGGVARLRDLVEPYTAERAAEICGVPIADLETFAAMITAARRIGIETGTGVSMGRVGEPHRVARMGAGRGHRQPRSRRWLHVQPRLPAGHRGRPARRSR